MADQPTDQPAPITVAEQELRMVTIVLQARGWLITDSRQDPSGLTIIARKLATAQPLTMEDLRARG